MPASSADSEDNVKNVLQLLERSAARFPDKIAFADETTALTYADLERRCRQVGTALAGKGLIRRVIAVYLPQCVDSLIAAFGAVYASDCYVMIDYRMPPARIRTILDTVRPAAVLTDPDGARSFAQVQCDAPVLTLADLFGETDADLLRTLRARQIDTDPVYMLFTSGSTGVPKGTVIHHRNVLAYSAWFCAAFSLDDTAVLGNQTPLYFSMSVSDVFGTLRAGATLHMIPKKLFSFPVKLLEFLRDRQVNTLYWVPSALCIVADWKGLDFVPLPDLKRVLFAGEVMPARQLNYWRKRAPDAQFANLFGPTETTDICCYYLVDRPIADDESVPIGFACDNCECLILREDGTRADAGETGELYVRGSFVASGYFADADRTRDAFVQNPLQSAYPEIVYRTGDLVRTNAYGEMEYVCRKDYQIKHMGYRIELGEIEAAAYAVEGIRLAVVLFDAKTDEIVLLYSGKKTDDGALLQALSARLPVYMLPSRIMRLREIPYNANGKIDRALLLRQYTQE